MKDKPYCHWIPEPLSPEEMQDQEGGSLNRRWRMGCTRWMLSRHIPDYSNCPYCEKEILLDTDND